ncbi:MAG: NUDIX hydrolase [Microthrixaceae bacterium]
MSTVGLHHPDPGSVPLRDAATVMLLRDGDAGLEVCMLQRNLQSDFVGGAYVFPGGGVDPEDATPDVEPVVIGRSDVEASRRVGVPHGGLAFWVAAIRESFEEAGVLLAVDPDGEVLSFADPTVAARFEVHRADVDHGRRRLAAVCAEEALRLDVGAIHYFSRWVTPLGANRRYDTRFFVAAAPKEQEALHDDREVIGTRWVTPDEAVADHEAGRINMIFPTVRTMVALRRFDAAEEVLAHAAAQGAIEPLVPLIEDVGGGMRIVLPGDPEGTGGVYDAFTAEPLST